MLQEKNSFIAYINHYDILQTASNEDLGHITRAVFEYAKNGIQIELPEHLVFAFGFIKNQLDIDRQKYNEKVEKLKLNGKKGGLAKAGKNNEEINPENNEENQAIAENECNNLPNLAIAKIAKHNVNVNENVNVNLNENDNLLSLNVEKEKIPEKEREIFLQKREITDEERKIVENYVRKNKLATKSVKAYASKIIQTGDYIRIVEEYRARMPAKNKDPILTIQEELASITDKKSAFRILAKYYVKDDCLPPEFNEIAKKYDLDTYDKAAQYSYEIGD